MKRRRQLTLFAAAIAGLVACGRERQDAAAGTGGMGAAGSGNSGAMAGSAGGAAAGAGAGGCAPGGCITDAGGADAAGCLSSDGVWRAPGETITMPPNCGTCTCQANNTFVCDFVPCPKDGEAPRDGGVCTNHQSCNEDPAISVTRGMCLERGLACHCGMYATSPYTGRCLNPGDDGSGCEYGGTSYPVGNMVPVLGCGGRCSCGGPGAIACPPGACVTCTLAEDYTISLPSGTSGYFFRPGASLTLSRAIPGTDVGASCSFPLAACDTPNAFDTSDLAADVAHADVQQALAASPAPVYGDRSSATPPTFTFRRSTSGSFSVIVGSECTTRTPTCEPTPAGVRRLVDDLNALVSTALATPNCARVR